MFILFIFLDDDNPLIMIDLVFCIPIQLQSNSNLHKFQDTQLNRRGCNTYVEAKSWTLQLRMNSVILKSQLWHYSIQHHLTWCINCCSMYKSLYQGISIKCWPSTCYNYKIITGQTTVKHSISMTIKYKLTYNNDHP